MAEKVNARLERLRLEQLGPDWENPRFLPGTAETLGDEADVYRFIDSRYDSYTVADSIARHGFFESEPLIAIPDGEVAEFTVVEGNRRLAALKALADPDLRATFADPRWLDIPKDVELPDELPVLVAEDRDQVAPILGFRHITGIAPWDPYQQARYVASLIDGEQGLSAEDVSALLGRKPGEVRAFYRNYSIVEQAEQEFEMEDYDRLIDGFGVWTRAMTSVGIRSYIGAPAPAEVVEREVPLADDAGEHLATLTTWLFGRPRTEEEREQGKHASEGRAISESRLLTRLGKAILNERGREALEAGEDLIGAERAMLDRRAVFGEAIRSAEESMEAAREHRPKRILKSPRESIEQIASIAAELQEGNDDRPS